MNKDTKILFMIESNLKKLFIKTIEEKKAGSSYVLRALIEDYVKGKKKSLDIRLQQEFKDYLNEKKFEREKKKHKRKLFYYYLISNTLKSIYKLSSGYLINSGELNMGIINKVIDSAEEVYNTYPEDIKNDLKIEFDNLKLLKDEKILIEKMKMLRLIKMKKQMEISENKEINIGVNNDCL